MKETDLSSYNNDHYKPGSLIARLLWYVVEWVFFQTVLMPFSAPKVFLLRLFGARVGKGVVIKPFVRIKYPWFLHIGDHVWIGEKVWIDNLALVQIESNVCISQGAMLLTGNHNYKLSTFNLITEGITIHRGAWIGAKSVVTPGTIVLTHAVLAVGSVGSGTLEAFTIYQGNPAVAVRKREIQ
jgi:putative colanic acid biosynthesis acetyltransferase WcaF